MLDLDPDVNSLGPNICCQPYSMDPSILEFLGLDPRVNPPLNIHIFSGIIILISQTFNFK
jgi:hypothetical protein